MQMVAQQRNQFSFRLLPPYLKLLELHLLKTSFMVEAFDIVDDGTIPPPPLALMLFSCARRRINTKIRISEENQHQNSNDWVISRWKDILRSGV